MVWAVSTWELGLLVEAWSTLVLPLVQNVWSINGRAEARLNNTECKNYDNKENIDDCGVINSSKDIVIVSNLSQDQADKADNEKRDEKELTSAMAKLSISG